MRRRQPPELNIDFYPSFIDMLMSVVLTLLFVITIFIVMQSGLVSLLKTKDESMAKLSEQLAMLEKELKLSETRTTLLKGELEGAMTLLQENRDNFSKEVAKNQTELAQTQAGLQKASVDLAATLARVQGAELEKQKKGEQLVATSKQIEELSKRVSEYLEQLKILNDQLTNTKQELTKKETSLNDLNTAVAKLNQQIQELNKKLADAQAEATTKKLELAKMVGQLDEREKEIARLRQLDKYRSEFLAKLAAVFQDNRDIKVVGDRFVFQGEVLFDSGKAELRPDGAKLLDRFVQTYESLSQKIPKDIGFNIQIQGHTDTDPIKNTTKFASNWELSTARATEVVRYLVSKGVPRNQMSAAGFAEYYPATTGVSEDSKRQNRRIEIFLTRR